MCGIFGVFNTSKAAELTVIGLHAIQHRAIDFTGIATSDGSNIYVSRKKGIARQAFSKDDLDKLHGKDALGHIRYPTVEDDPSCENIQPLLGYYQRNAFALAHNGNITNVEELQKHLPGIKYATSLDTELLVRLLEKFDSGDIEADIKKVLSITKGSATFVILMQNRLIAVRDKSGNRPLSIGAYNGGFFVSSETCAFANLEAQFIMDVPSGSMVIIEKMGYRVIKIEAPQEHFCRFETIYFAHPSSSVFGEEVTNFRFQLGEILEKHAPACGADIVTPVPDSSNIIALGYGHSGNSGRYLPVIIRSHYVGRTFIAATQASRDVEVANKFNFSEGAIKGKRIVVIDDSIVRGTTIPKIVTRLRKLGAMEVHIRIACPPIFHSCKYGINTPTSTELASVRHTSNELLRLVGADSLEFLPMSALKELSGNHRKFCYACWDGNYWN